MVHIPEDDRTERATERTTLGGLAVGDLVPGWLGLCRVTRSEPRADGMHYAEFAGRDEYGMELGRASVPWRRVPADQADGGDGRAAAALS